MNTNPRKSVAVFAGTVLLCLCSLFSLPAPSGAPVPVTLHDGAAVLLGILLGPAAGAGSVGLFFLAGAAGLPLFPGGQATIQAFRTVTGGYLIGWFLAAVIAGLCTHKIQDTDSRAAAFPAILHGAVAGILCSSIPAILALKNLYGAGLAGAILHAFVPYLPAILVKLVLSVITAGALRKPVWLWMDNGKNKQIS